MSRGVKQRQPVERKKKRGEMRGLTSGAHHQKMIEKVHLL
jgi:hypothetical protein